MSVLKKNFTKSQRKTIETLISNLGPVATRKQILEFAKANNISPLPWWISRVEFEAFKVKRGTFNLEAALAADTELASQVAIPVVVESATPEITTVVA